MKEVKVCEWCKGSGLEPCEENNNILAKDHRKYIVCTECKGEGAS